jgi:hypothetical protein
MTSSILGVIAVDRLWLLERARASGVRKGPSPALDMTEEEVFRRYRGFDGQVWPVREHPDFATKDGLAPLSALPAVRRYVATLDPRCEIVILSTNELQTNGDGNEKLRFVGWDVGFFESEWSHFSSILHECVFGSDEVLRSYAERLNSSVLFEHQADALAFLGARAEAAGRGAELESDAEFAAFAIHVPESADRERTRP